MILFVQESANAVKSISENSTGLTLGGWIFISIAWTCVISLFIFCYRKILQKPNDKKQQGEFESTSGHSEVTNQV